MTISEVIILALSLIILCLLLLVYCFRVEVHGYELQLKMLEIETKQQAQQFEEAKRRSDEEMVKVRKQSRIILATNVPKDCGSAIKWAIGQANGF